MRYPALKIVLAFLALPGSRELCAQRPTLSTAVRAFVAVDSPIVALTHARVIDGTGAPARDDQTLVIRDGRITALGASGSIDSSATFHTWSICVTSYAGRTQQNTESRCHQRLKIRVAQKLVDQPAGRWLRAR